MAQKNRGGSYGRTANQQVTNFTPPNMEYSFQIWRRVYQMGKGGGGGGEGVSSTLFYIVQMLRITHSLSGVIGHMLYDTSFYFLILGQQSAPVQKTFGLELCEKILSVGALVLAKLHLCRHCHTRVLVCVLLSHRVIGNNLRALAGLK